MKRVLFLVHGMGNHQDNWYTPVAKTIRDIYNKPLYSKLGRKPFEDRFEIVPIRYDHIFRELLKKWETDASALGKVPAVVSPAIVKMLTKWLKGAPDLQDNFAWTHASDVLLYRIFGLVRKRVQTHVALQISDKVASLPSGWTWSVLAHSLGTAVAHDSLDMLFTGRLRGGAVTGLDYRAESAKLVMMVANVSRVLQTRPKVMDKNDTTVIPGKGCMFYFNVRHKLDPFTIPKPFDEDIWPNIQVTSRGEYQHIQPNHIHEPNIHDFSHYLKNPHVHIPMFQALMRKTIFTQKQIDEATSTFRQFDGGGLEKYVTIRKALQELPVSTADDWESLIAIWDLYQEFKNKLS